MITCNWAGCALVAAALATGSCGGSDGGPTTPTTTPPPGGTAAVTINIVATGGAQSFTPNPATQMQSGGVAWRNSDGVVHRIVANDGSFDTGNIAPGATSGVITLNSDGTNYHCTLHPGMIGSVNASSGTPPPCTGIYC